MTFLTSILFARGIGKAEMHSKFFCAKCSLCYYWSQYFTTLLPGTLYSVNISNPFSYVSLASNWLPVYL